MKERSIVERSIKDCSILRESLTPAETKIFNKIKRSLMRTFVKPNHAVKILIDLSAMEYIRYIRGLNGDENISRTAKSIVDLLCELDLTPKSKKNSEVSKTLSQIFQSISDTSTYEAEIE